MVTLCGTLHAQIASKVHTSRQLNQGDYVTFNTSYADTLKSGDTLSYVFPVTHINCLWPYMTQKFRLVANDATVTVKFYQSMDGITYYQVLAGGTPSAYTKTVATTSGSSVQYSFIQDTAQFESRYLKVMYFAAVNSGFKTIPYGTVKLNLY